MNACSIMFKMYGRFTTPGKQKLKKQEFVFFLQALKTQRFILASRFGECVLLKNHDQLQYD